VTNEISKNITISINGTNHRKTTCLSMKCTFGLNDLYTVV
jgi:hypothetical protein